MEFSDVLPFLQANHRAVVTTFRRSGAAQMSIVSGGPYKGTMAFVVRGDTAKLATLRRDPRCSALTAADNWRGYVVVAGMAMVQGWDNTDPEELRIMLREVYMAAGGRHSDFEEYDRVMKAERRAVVMVSPDHVNGIRFQDAT